MKPKSPFLIIVPFLISWLLPAQLKAGDTPSPPPIPATAAKEEAHPPSIYLWPNGAPGSESRKAEAERVDWRQEPDIVFPVVSNIHNPSITPFLPSKGKATGCAVVIAPGGGHMFHTIDREGYDLGHWLADHGIAAFVLKYRLARDQSNPKNTAQPYQADVHAVADAQRAVRFIRSRAKEWNIDPRHLGFIGFSAGGEVGALLVSRDGKGDASAGDPVDRMDARPDFLGLAYPGMPREFYADGGLAEEKLKGFPPTFLICASNDRPNVAEYLPSFYVSLKKARVPVELHIYQEGGHGFGVRPRDLSVTHWPTLFADWIKDNGFLGTK